MPPGRPARPPRYEANAEDFHRDPDESDSDDTDSDLDMQEDSDAESDLAPEDAPEDGAQPHFADEEELLAHYVTAGLSRPEIVVHMSQAGHPMSLATVGRRLASLGLSTAHPLLTPEERDEALSLIRQCHRLGFSRTECVDHLRDAYHMPITLKILRTMSRDINLNWRLDDLQTGKMTRDQLKEIIRISIEGEDADAGYRCLQAALAIRGIRVRRDTVLEIMREIDPEGIALRLKGKLKRRRFFCSGPNYIWSSDGHDKLKPYGIMIYAFIDAWSRKVLSFDVGINNNDPRTVAYLYLKTVRSIGGIPVQTCTDHGTETVKLAALQVYFTSKYGGEPMENAVNAHLFTTSPRNQKIESLWSLVRRRHGKALQRFFQDAIDSLLYNPEDPLQK